MEYVVAPYEADAQMAFLAVMDMWTLLLQKTLI